MYVCMDGCMYGWMDTACTYMCVYADPSTTCPSVYVCTYACMYVCSYVCMYVCTYVRMCMCVCVCVCVYASSQAMVQFMNASFSLNDLHTFLDKLGLERPSKVVIEGENRPEFVNFEPQLDIQQLAGMYIGGRKGGWICVYIHTCVFIYSYIHKYTNT